jgi:hypothetical protein
MEKLEDSLLWCNQKLQQQRSRLSIFDGKTNIKKLTTDQAIIINEVNIILFFMMDRFPIIMLETLEKNELESINNIQKEIEEIQARVMEILGKNDLE